MRDTNFSDLLDDINNKHGQMRMSALFGWTAAMLAAFVLLAAGAVAIAVAFAVPVAWGLGRWLDSYQRATVVFYDVDETAHARFTRICEAFDELAGCRGKWHIEAGKIVTDLTTWKRQAGASHLVRRTATALSYQLPAILKSNITPPSIRVGRRSIYFLPDVALVQDKTGFGAVGYDQIRVSHQPSRFIEEGPVPSDAQVVDQTWQHPNKSGGPDRRFKVNRRLPVCLYEDMHLHSLSGLNELLEFSRTGLAAPFARAIAAVPKNDHMTGVLPRLAAS